MFFSTAITAPSTSIQPMLPTPTPNISNISDQQQPTQKSPWWTPSLSAYTRSFPPLQCSVMKLSGDRHLSRHIYFNGVNWYTPARISVAAPIP